MPKKGVPYTWLGIVIGLLVVVGGAAWYTSQQSSYSTSTAEGSTDSSTRTQSEEHSYEYDPAQLTTSEEIWTAWKDLTQRQRELNERYDRLNEKGSEAVDLRSLKQDNRRINRRIIDELDRHFRNAIEKEPDNAFNHMSYAYYLFPRNREKAWSQFNKALETEKRPEFYGLWAELITTPVTVGGQVFVSNLDDDRIQQNGRRALEMLDTAYELDPANGALPLRKATVSIKLARRGILNEPSPEEIYSMVKEANSARDFYFCLPPPIPYRTKSWQRLWAPWKELGDLARPRSLRGVWPAQSLQIAYQKLVSHFEQTGELDALRQANEMMLNATLTKPYDRTYFEMHKRMARSAVMAIKDKYPNAIKGHEVTNSKVIYQDGREALWNELITMGYRPSEKPKWFDVEAWESNWQRDPRLFDMFFPHQRSLYNHVNKTLQKVRKRLQDGEGD